MFRFTPELTKQWIRERISDEEIFSRYLGVRVEFGTKFCSPLRTDKKPTCNYFVTRNGILWMKDHSGHFAGDCYTLVMFMFNVDYFDALKIIAKDFNLLDIDITKDFKIKENKVQISSKAEIIVQPRQLRKSDLDFWNKFMIGEEDLKFFKIYPVQYCWVNKELRYIYHENDPAYCYLFGPNDLKIYFPKRKEARFLCNTNVLQGYNYLPPIGDILIITKSYKDVIVLRKLGFYAIAPQSETQSITEGQYKDLKERFKNIKSWYDFDLTGVRTANKMRKQYGIQPIFLTNGRFGSVAYGSKDISDFIVQAVNTSEFESIKKRISELFI